MKKTLFFLVTAFSLTLNACMPSIFQTDPASPLIKSEVDLQATVARSVQQTLHSMPTPTFAPRNKALTVGATTTPSQIRPTTIETQNPLLLALTATLGTGTVITDANILGLTGTLRVTPKPAFSVTSTETLHPRHYGTMPPNLPSGSVLLINRSKAEVYVSLQCTTVDGYLTIIEYPVGYKLETQAPAGKYIYVVWVGGNKIVGRFKLDKFQDLTLIIYKDRVEIK